MPDKRVTELDPIDTVAAGDLLLLVDDPGGTPINKKATVTQLLAAAGPAAPAAHRLAHETGGSDALTALSATVLTTGTLPDARLSADVARRGVANTFTANQSYTSAIPRAFWTDTGEVADFRTFDVLNYQRKYQIWAKTEAAVVTGSLTLDRTGNLVLTGTVTATGLATTPLNATNLTSGTVPAAALTAANLPAHATRHQPGGADAMAVDAVAATGSLRTLGTGATQAAPGNDARFTDARAPLAHRTTHETGGSDALAALSAAILTTGTLPDARFSANVLLKPIALGDLPSTVATKPVPIADGGTGVTTGLTVLDASNLTTGSVAFARISVSAASKLLGRGTSGAGTMEEVTLGTGLAMTGTTLSATAAGGGGDVYLAQQNVFTAKQTIDCVGPQLIVTGSGPQITLKDPGVATTLQRIRLEHWSQEFRVGRSDDDAGTNWAPLLTVARATGDVTVAGVLKVNGNLVSIESGIGYTQLQLKDTAAPVDQKDWTIFLNSGVSRQLHFRAETDAGGLVSDALILGRDGTTTFGGSLLTIMGGNPRLSFSDALQGADLKVIRIMNQSQQLVFHALNDAQSAIVGPVLLTLTRTGALTTGGALTVNGATSFVGTEFRLQGTNNYARLHLRDATVASNSQTWVLLDYQTKLYLCPANDDGTLYIGSNWDSGLTIDRSGNVQVKTRLQIGGTTSAYPALRNSGNNMDIVYGDASGWAGVTASHYYSHYGGNSLADLTCRGGASFANSITITGGHFYGGYVYPGNWGSGTTQSTWHFAGHSSYGIYCNTGLYAEGGVWCTAVEGRAHIRAAADLYSGGGVFEQGRAARLGYVTQVDPASYFSAPYFAYGGNMSYAFVGKMAFIQLNVSGAVNAGAPNQAYYTLTLPGGATACNTGHCAISVYDTTGWATGIAAYATNQTTLLIYGGATRPWVAGQTVYIYMNGWVPIN